MTSVAKAPYNTSLGLSSASAGPVVSQYAVNYRKPVPGMASANSAAPAKVIKPAANADISQQFSLPSPTASISSETLDGKNDARSWDEKKVAEWLRSINCGQYEQLFKVNHVNGSNLIECDQLVLKEIGIKKIGDRVKIFVAIKALRTRAVGNHRKRSRDSLAAMDSRSAMIPTYNTSPSTTATSPRNLPPTPMSSLPPTSVPYSSPVMAVRDREPLSAASISRGESGPSSAASSGRRWSRQVDANTIQDYLSTSTAGRPSSPLADPSDLKNARGQRHGGMSPLASSRENAKLGYFVSPGTPVIDPNSAKINGQSRTSNVATVQMRHTGNADQSIGRLAMGSALLRVIYTNGQTKVLDIKNCRTLDDIMQSVLRRFNIHESQARNYCFWNLDGTGLDLSTTHQITDQELINICSEPFDCNERGRLILRKRNAGGPDEEELRKASAIALEEQSEVHQNALQSSNARSQLKVQKLTGETWRDASNPLAPTTFQAPKRSTQDSPQNDLAEQTWSPPRAEARLRPKIKEYLGGRPPSELISQELTTYFPDHQKETIERTVRMSMRRSARLSKAASRISVASSASLTPSLKDAPPLPNIADAWLNGTAQSRPHRPLSITRFGNSSYRDSIASTSLQPLAEESALEPNRKSYVSFDSDSIQTEPHSGSLVEADGSTTGVSSYFDESLGRTGSSSGEGSNSVGTEAGDSLNDYLSNAIAADGEEPDEELTQFLRGDTWDNVQWMQGALIGQGSFGSVFLALHGVTGELMAVKQVEVPSNSNSALDKKKEGMVAALRREIDLLRDLKHDNIVQYFGSSADDHHFNIFLEYVPGGSVAAMLNSYGSLQEPLIRNFVRQILAGLSYLHGREIIHRDIKGANILVDNKGKIKISDFGISKRVEASALLSQPSHGNRKSSLTSATGGSKGLSGHGHRPSLQGSVFWMAPEVVKQTSYTRKADIWSLGCLIVEMYTGTHPFPNCSQLQAIFQIGNSSAKPNIPDTAGQEAQDFLTRTFEIDHEKRPSADELLLSPFLKQLV